MFGLLLWRDYVTGFHKRKKKRRKEAQKQQEEALRRKRIEDRKKVHITIIFMFMLEIDSFIWY